MDLTAKVIKFDRAVEAFKTAVEDGSLGNALGNRLQSKVNQMVESLGDDGNDAACSLKSWLHAKDEWRRLYGAMVIVSAARDEEVHGENEALECLADLAHSKNYPVAKNAGLTLLSIGMNLLGVSGSGGTRVIPWQSSSSKVVSAVRSQLAFFKGSSEAGQQ
jgi:hypothetical protein